MLDEVRQQIESYAAIEPIASRIQYQWLDEFIKSIDEGDLRERMEAAINGKGAFRRFKDILLTLPDERRRWFEFRDHKMRERITNWVRERGLDAQNDPPWLGTKAPTVSNLPNQHADIETLRDFMIAWLDAKQVDFKAITIDELSMSLSERFRIQPRAK